MCTVCYALDFGLPLQLLIETPSLSIFVSQIVLGKICTNFYMVGGENQMKNWKVQFQLSLNQRMKADIVVFFSNIVCCGRDYSSQEMM